MKRVRLRLVACGSTRHPEFMTRAGGSRCAKVFPALVGIIEHPDEGLILFDTGYDLAFFAATAPFPERLYRWTTPVTLDARESAVAWLTRLGHSSGDVRAIILSHFHGDHVAGLAAFPDARIFCAESGLADLQRRGRFGRVRRGLLRALVPDDIDARATFFERCPATTLHGGFQPFEAGHDLLGDGSLIAVELPGHCPGHWGLAMRIDDDRHVLLIGDAAWSIGAIEDGAPPPRLTTALLGDTRRYRATLNQLTILRHRNPEIVLLPAHCLMAARSSSLLENHAA